LDFGRLASPQGMHPIVLLLIAGTGAYFLYDAMEDETPEVQGLKNKDGDTVVVPTKAYHRRPKSSVTDVPPPAVNGPQAIHDPPPAYQGPRVDLKVPALVTSSGHTTSLTVQSVADIQRALNALGFGPLAVTGTVTGATQKAIAAFQEAYGLPSTGHVDLFTKKSVEASLGSRASAGSTVASSPLVQQASPSTAAHFARSAGQMPVTDVASLQRALNVLGAKPPLKIDGVIGDKTTAAIKAFQIASGLVADGVAGPKTLIALQAAVDPKTAHAISA
jgi:peptidoglycan hydrolase-like protein with peptidoglycan-binding domain